MNEFDKGFETGKTEAKIEAEAKQKAMVEALRMCKGKFLQLKMNKVLDTSHYIKQIDAVLEE